MTNESKYRKITLLSARGLNPKARALRFKFADSSDAKEFTFTPGGFVMISVPGFGEAPFTITTSPSELPEFEIAVRTVGNTSMSLNRLQKGDIAYIRGPLGNAADFQEIYGRELILIGGGIGLAPLRSIIHYLGEHPETVAKLTIIHGSKTPEELIFKDELNKWKAFADVHPVVNKADEHWEGEIGHTTDVLKKLMVAKDASVILCGPPAMYKSAVDVLKSKGIAEKNIFLMLERRMKCGIGKCQHCTCGKQYVCLDGPTFRYSELMNNPEASREL